MAFSLRTSAIAFLATAALVASAQRAPTVSYTVSGSAGNWTLDFTLQSNFNAGEGDFYFFGVNVDSGPNATNSPAFWDSTAHPTWNPLTDGGSGPNETFNNTWLDNGLTFNMVNPGQSLSGFDVLCTDTVAPTTVDFFAYAALGNYGGTDNFNPNVNPGFSGRALPPSGTPEPFTMGSIVLCLGGAVRRKLKARA